MTIEEQAQKAMDKCKYKIITKAKHTFIMSIMFGTGFEWKEEGIWAGATDGETIFINPKFFIQADENFRTFLLLHETYHIVFKHCVRALRMKNINQEKMNAAEDYMINLIIYDEMGWHPPDDMCLFDLQYRGMSSMQIYKLLPDNIKPPEMDVQKKPSEKGDESDKQKADDMEADVNTRLITASVAHENKTGAAPGIGGPCDSLGRYLEDLFNPTINWLPIARRHMTKYARERLSLNKPNRRYLAHRIIMPSRCGKGMEDICVYVDSSGSVSPDELNEYVAFVRHMHKQLKPDNLYIKSFDDSLHPGGVYKRNDNIPGIELQGGGGTEIQPVINDCFAIKPKLVVIFTDGWFYAQKEKEVPFDLVWIILDNPKFTSNIGRIIHHTTK